ncbi:hypothetical protein BDF14DRAFT_981283 [Spinellus fusiger]|nr:hypothetical protein BDF14DRAFT_981283 [Spinellus fusiger]
MKTYRWHSCSTNDFPFRSRKVRKACIQCRIKKIRCNGTMPCKRCHDNNVQCNYDQNIKRVKQSLALKNPMELLTSIIPLEQSKITPSLPIRYTLKISEFSNRLYDTINTQLQKNGSNTQSFSHLPPLLCDYFHLTSQPTIIWKALMQLFQLLLERHKQQITMKALITEALGLFSAYNVLYSSFIDMQCLQEYIENSSHFDIPNATESNDTIEWLFINIITALTFQAAYQSLTVFYPGTASDLQHYSQQFYFQAHSHFLQLTFPKTPNLVNDKVSSRNLVRAAILLSHYQCTAICKDQALMTLRLGLVFAQRCYLLDQSKIDKSLSTIEKERLAVLSIVLNGWHTWFKFYLHQGEDEQDGKDIANLDTYSTPTTDEEESSVDKKYQKWTLHVVVIYTHFMNDLLSRRKKGICLQEIKVT